MRYGYQIHYTDPLLLGSRGFGKVAGIPCIFDPTPRFHRLSSEFLIDRALGYWNPTTRGSEITPIPPTTASIKNYAERLCNLLDWCELKCLDFLSLKYSDDLIGQYQKDMLDGSWSRDGSPLSENTVNVRVDAAVDLMNWCVDKGYRGKFNVPKRTHTYSDSPDWKARGKCRVDARLGKARRKQKRLCFPPEEEIRKWRKGIADRPERGPVEYLIIDLIMETAIRREEAACWRVDAIPFDESEWNIVDPDVSDADRILLVEIRYGAKGKEYGRDHGDKIGPMGIIRVPYLLAKRINHYRVGLRNSSLEKKIKTGTTIKNQLKIRGNAVHLFLRPDTGERYSSADIYEFWRRVKRPSGWSPHRARDYWACSLLMLRIQQYKELLAEISMRGYDQSMLAIFKMNCESVIQLEIRPQLRHATSNTSMVYLQWAADKFGLNLNLHDQWIDTF